MTERHCWHPERLLRRLWPSTSGTRQKGEGLYKDLGTAWQSSSHSYPDTPPSPQGQAATTALPPQHRCSWKAPREPSLLSPTLTLLPRLSTPALAGAAGGSRRFWQGSTVGGTGMC